jgi:predicted anti-sigma-YlaC factor YlaD
MRCERSRRLIGLELDGRLDAGDAARLEAHLAGCEGCRSDRAAVAQAWERLGALPAGRAPREDWAAIQVRIAEQAEHRPWLRWPVPVPVRRGLAAAGLAGLAAFGILAGDAMAQAALGPDGQPPSVEALAIADGFGLAPFGGPSAGLLLGNGRDGGLR